MQEQEFNYEETIEQFGGELPYFFSSSITKKRTIRGKTYIVRRYFVGGKDFNETVKNLAVKQAYKKMR